MLNKIYFPIVQAKTDPSAQTKQGAKPATGTTPEKQQEGAKGMCGIL